MGLETLGNCSIGSNNRQWNNKLSDADNVTIVRAGCPWAKQVSSLVICKWRTSLPRGTINSVLRTESIRKNCLVVPSVGGYSRERAGPTLRLAYLSCTLSLQWGQTHKKHSNFTELAWIWKICHCVQTEGLRQIASNPTSLYVTWTPPLKGLSFLKVHLTTSRGTWLTVPNFRGFTCGNMENLESLNVPIWMQWKFISILCLAVSQEYI